MSYQVIARKWRPQKFDDVVGQQAVTLDRVATEKDVGHALLAGERWLAISADGRAIDADRPVTVTAVVGTTLVVWPTGAFPPPGPDQLDHL